MDKDGLLLVEYRIYIIPQNTLHLNICQGLRIMKKMTDFCSIDFHMDIDMKKHMSIFTIFSYIFLLSPSPD